MRESCVELSAPSPGSSYGIKALLAENARLRQLCAEAIELAARRDVTLREGDRSITAHPTASLPAEPGLDHAPPELLIDLVADNAQLREALAVSEGAGVRRELITQELKHRIGNLLTLVQAIARRTFANAEEASVADFTARLNALAAAQALLIDAETRAAMMSDVVRGALAAHCPDGDRFTISGPDIALDGRRAHALTLALHELATNAVKYGALSIEAGRLDITWSVEGGQLDFLWREHSGPRVTAPTRKGFGSRLITGNLSIAFLGEVDLDFKASGLECRLRGAR